MKRHPSLAPLSREHHGALILARLLQNNAPIYKGLPADIEGKALYALNFYSNELIRHFADEEKAFKLIKGTTDKIDSLTQAIVNEHKELHTLFETLKNKPPLPSHLDRLGKLLEIHIRKEERELFPLIEENCSEGMMKEIAKLFSSKVKKDIETRTDIELLVNFFYAKIMADKQLGFIFQNMAKVNWSSHLPAMYNFWENIILFTGSYEGNPMNLHHHLHHITPLNAGHFYQWNKLFTGTVDELFEGPKANLAKQRAISISDIIKKNILDFQEGIENRH